MISCVNYNLAREYILLWDYNKTNSNRLTSKITVDLTPKRYNGGPLGCKQKMVELYQTEKAVCAVCTLLYCADLCQM